MSRTRRVIASRRHGRTSPAGRRQRAALYAVDHPFESTAEVDDSSSRGRPGAKPRSRAARRPCSPARRRADRPSAPLRGSVERKAAHPRSGDDGGTSVSARSGGTASSPSRHARVTPAVPLRRGGCGAADDCGQKSRIAQPDPDTAASAAPAQPIESPDKTSATSGVMTTTYPPADAETGPAASEAGERDDRAGDASHPSRSTPASRTRADAAAGPRRDGSAAARVACRSPGTARPAHAPVRLSDQAATVDSAPPRR